MPWTDVLREQGVIVGDDIWMTYFNEDRAKIQFVKFDTDTLKFDCTTKRDIMDWYGDLPTGCSQYPCQAKPMLQGTADPCLRAGGVVSPIDVFDTSSSNLIGLVTNSSKGSGSCTRSRMRIARTTNGGNTWDIVFATQCSNSVHTDVAFPRTPEAGSLTPGLVHAFSLYDAAGGKLAPVRWKSTDFGSTWSGVYIDSGMASFPDVPGAEACYWGDYDGIVADVANNTMYDFWGNGEVSSDWVIRAKGWDEQ